MTKLKHLILVVVNSTLLFSIGLTQSIQNIWVANEMDALEFKTADRMYSRTFSEYKKYSLSNDQITFFESDLKESSKKHPKFKFEFTTKDTLTLFPLNESALNFVQEVKNNSMRYSPFLHNRPKLQMDSMRKTNWFKQKLKFSEENSNYNRLHFVHNKIYYDSLPFDSIQFSSKSIGMIETYFCDVKLYTNGSYYIRKSDDKGKMNVFEGSLSIDLKKSIDSTYSHSNFFNLLKDTYGGSMSHPTLIRLKVFANNKSRFIRITEGFTPVSVTPFVKKLLKMSNLKNQRLTNRKIQFDLSFKED